MTPAPDETKRVHFTAVFVVHPTQAPNREPNAEIENDADSRRQANAQVRCHS